MFGEEELQERANLLPDKWVRAQGNKSQGVQVLRVAQLAHTGQLRDSR